jgi:hypothetical protein
MTKRQARLERRRVRDAAYRTAVLHGRVVRWAKHGAWYWRARAQVYFAMEQVRLLRGIEAITNKIRAGEDPGTEPAPMVQPPPPDLQRIFDLFGIAPHNT